VFRNETAVAGPFESDNKRAVVDLYAFELPLLSAVSQFFRDPLLFGRQSSFSAFFFSEVFFVTDQSLRRVAASHPFGPALIAFMVLLLTTLQNVFSHSKIFKSPPKLPVFSFSDLSHVFRRSRAGYDVLSFPF